jgi:hypothetical protein
MHVKDDILLKVHDQKMIRISFTLLQQINKLVFIELYHLLNMCITEISL